jgi:LysM repeat protein
MDWQDLQQAVDGLISDGVLTLDQSHHLESPPILDLLTSTRLLSIIANVSTQGYQGTHYVVTGTIDRVNFPYVVGSTGNPLPVTLDFFVQDTLAHVTATVTLPSNYTLGMSFPYLVDEAIDLFPVGTAKMGFASAGSDPPLTPSSILLPPPYRGMSIAGTMSGLARNPLTASLLWFLPDRDTFSVSGPVIISEGLNYQGATEYRPTLYLIGALLEPLSLRPFRLGLSLMAQSTYEKVKDSDQSSFFSGAYFLGQLQAAITPDKGIDVLMQMELIDGYQSLYSFELSKPIPLTSLNELQDIAALGSGSYSAMVPSEVPIGTGLALEELSFVVAPTLQTLASMIIGVKLTVHWEVIPNVFTLENMALRFVVPSPTAGFSGMVATATAELRVFDGIFDVSMIFPSLRITGQIRQGTQISYEAVCNALFGKVLELPWIANPTLYELNVDIEPREQTYQVSGVVIDVLSVNLGFVTIDLDEVGVGFSYSPLSQAGRFEAQFTLVTPANQAGEGDDPITFQFYVSAAGMRAGTVTTWNVEGGIGVDHVIPLGTLVARLLGFSVGQDVSILDIEDVYVAMTIPSAGPSTFYFEGAARSRWTIDIFGGWSIEILAAAQLERRPADASSQLKLPTARAADGAGMQTSGEISGSLAINNFKLTVIYQFAPDSQVLIFQASYKQVTLTAALSKGKDAAGQDTYLLKFNLSGVTLGDLITWMVNLARPDSDFSLDSPWDVLNGIDLSRFALIVDLVKKTVTVSYEVNADFIFLRLKSVGLTYYRNQGKGSVKITIEGSFLDVTYGYGEPPLEWDLMDDPPPAVPGKTGLFELRYLGLGQHVSLASYAAIDTVEQAIEGLRAAMRPPTDPQENPLLQPGANALNFDANSHWLFGADFTALGTLQLSLVFNDPYIYGALIRLMGEKAGPLAGLRFELLYKKVTDDIGVFKADFIVPDAFRQIEFGEVSITLGRIHVDVYTNGNFLADLGFPHNRDFSFSFGLQVFPFVGWGGFYFASLTGATSTKVPRIDNGAFNPVIELGLGLSVGVGKTIEKGPLSAGLTLTLEAIVEGVFADFAPTDKSGASGFFYHIEGTAALVGRVYGKVDFVVIRVDVSAEASARITLVIEAHQPIFVQLELHVDVRASIKVLFVRIHFSFSVTLDLAFTIGHATATPWHAVADQTQRLDLLATRSLPHWPFPAARPHYKRLLRTTRLLRHVAAGDSPSAFGLLHREEIRRSALPHLYLQRAAAGAITWTPAKVFPNGTVESLRLLCMPAFTVADPGIGSNGTPGAYRLVLTMGAETSRAPGTRTDTDLGAPSVAHSLQAEAVVDAPFNLFIEAFLRWSLDMVKQDGQVTAVALDELAANLRLPATADTGFAYANLITFLKDNFLIAIAGKPSGSTPDEVPVAAFPMLPLLTYRAKNGTPVPFDQPQYTLTREYKAALDAIFYQLSPTGSPTSAFRDDETAESFAQFIFRECCLMVAQAAVDACIGMLESFSYGLDTGTTLQSIVDAFAPHNIEVKARRGQKLSHLAALFGTSVGRLQALNQSMAANEGLAGGDTIVVPVELTFGAIVDDNRDHALAAPKTIPVGAAPHQVRGDRSLNQIAADYGFASATGLVTAETAAQPDVLLPQASIPASGLQYTTRAGDTVAAIAALYLARRSELGDAAARQALAPDVAHWFAQAVADLNATQDFSGIIPANTVLTVPQMYDNTQTTAQYTTYAGDTLTSIADALSLLNVTTPPPSLTAYEQAINQANPNLPNPIPANTAVVIPAFTLSLPARVTLNDLASGLIQSLNTAVGLVADNAAALTPQTVIVVPAFNITTTVGDTFATLAQTYDLSYDQLGEAAKAVAGIFATTPSNVVTLKDLPRAGVEQLVMALIEGQGLANQISGQISRFLLHGVRAPSPDASDPLTAPLQSIFDLSRQQFAGPDPVDYSGGQTYPIVVSLTNPADQSWISFEASETAGAGDTLASLRARIADFDQRNPAAAGNPDRIRPGRIVRTGDVTDLTITITHDEMVAGYPTRTFTPDVVTPLAPLRLYRLVPLRYGVQQYLGWQAGAAITLPSSADAVDPVTGGPGIWMFPDTVFNVIAGQVGATAAYELLQVAATDLSSISDPTEAASYGWATLVPFGAKQIARDDDPDQVLPHTYGIGGADAEGRNRLLDLYQHLAAMTPADLALVRLYLLHQPRADTTRPQGLVSVPLDAVSTYVLKANLTTETRSGAQAELVRRGLAQQDLLNLYAAPISDPVGFTGLLWAASITNSGGFYLNYRGSEREGLPAGIFGKGGGGGEVWLMALLPDQTTGTPSQRGLYKFNNCAVTGGNLLPADWQLFMQLAQNAPTVKVASVDPGVIAFATALNNPDLTPPSAAQVASELFSLIAYDVAETAIFNASYQALPVGPEESAQANLPVEFRRRTAVGNPADAPYWLFHQGLRIAGRAKVFFAPDTEGLPAPDQDPYAGIGDNTVANLDFQYRDVFGNQTLPDSAYENIAFPVGYTDPVIGIGQWPGVAAAYQLLPGSPSSLALSVGYQMLGALPGMTDLLAGVQARTVKTVARFAQIYYQVMRPDLAVQLTTTLPVAPDASKSYKTLDKAPFTDFAGAAYLFLNATLRLQEAQADLRVAPTLAQIQSTYRVTAGQIASINGATSMDRIFAANLTVPQYYTIAPGDSATSIVAAHPLAPSPASFLVQNAGLALTPGKVLSAPTYTINSGTAQARLNDIAASNLCSVGGLGTANADVAGILAPGLTLAFEQIVLTAQGNETLTQLANRFSQALLGQTPANAPPAWQVTPADLANANASVAPFFADNQTITVADTVAGTRDTLASLAARHSQYSVSNLAAQNTTLVDIFPSGLAALLATTQVAPPANATLADFAAANGLTGEQLIAANGATALKTTTPLKVPGMTTLPTADEPAAPFYLQSGQTLAAAGQNFGLTAEPFATLNAALPNRFTGSPVFANNGHQVQANDADSFAALLVKAEAAGVASTMDELVGLIDAQPASLRPRALYAGPAVVTSAVMSLQALADLYNVTPSQLALANPGQLRFTAASGDITYQGGSFTVSVYDTLNALSAAFSRIYGIDAPIGPLAAANAATLQVSASQPFLLPVCPAVASAGLDTASVGYPDSIFKIEVAVALVRMQESYINPNFRDAAAANVRAATSGIPPVAQAQSQQTLSLTDFAKQFEAALPNVKIGTGRRGAGTAATPNQNSPRDLWALVFGAQGFSAVTLDGASADFYGIKPLWRKLITRNNVMFKEFHDGWDAAATPHSFQSIDIESWALSFLNAMDLLLSPGYAAALYALDFNAENGVYARIADAKQTLVSAIGNGVAPILANAPDTDQTAAKAKLEDRLKITLADNYQTTAIAQFPVHVTGTTAHGPARLVGKPLALRPVTGASTRGLDSLAASFGVWNVYLAEVVAEMPKVLNQDLTVTIGASNYEIGPDSTIAAMTAFFGYDSIEAFVAALPQADNAVLFAQDIELNLQGLTRQVAGAPGQFEALAQYFDVSVGQIARANADTAGIFTQGAVLAYPGKPDVTITIAAPATTTLLDATTMFGGEAATTPQALAQANRTAAIIAQGFAAKAAEIIPEHSLSTGKLNLSSASSTVNILFNVASEEQHKKVFLDLNYEINEVEYDIRVVPDTGGYERSDWLSLIIPINQQNGAPQGVSIDPGLQEIPVPLRYYPAAPALLGQSGGATRPNTTNLGETKLWTYSTGYQLQMAEQDAPTFTVTSNAVVGYQPPSLAGDDPAVVLPLFEALAQFVTVYPQLSPTLASLLTDGGNAATQLSAASAFADMAANVASAWTLRWTPPPARLAARAGDTPFPPVPVSFDIALTVRWSLDPPAIDTIVLTLATDAPTGVVPFPDVTATWADIVVHPTKQSIGTRAYVYQFQPSAEQPHRNIPAFETVGYKWDFAGLNIILQQTAISALEITRNASLVSRGPTAVAFVYTTPLTGFSNALLPFVQQGGLIDITNLGSNVGNALAAALTQLLAGDPATARAMRLALQYGYELAPPLGGGEPIISNLPIAFLPQFAAGQTGDVQAVIDYWLTHNTVSQTNSRILLNLTIYSGMPEDADRPVLEVQRLEYRLSP